jgi:hypothetical protein
MKSWKPVICSEVIVTAFRNRYLHTHTQRCAATTTRITRGLVEHMRNRVRGLGRRGIAFALSLDVARKGAIEQARNGSGRMQ